MEASLIQTKLRQAFPHQIQNFNILQFPGSLNQRLSKIVNGNLPFLPLEQIHFMCRNQQRNVMQKLIEVKKIDIYKEIAKVCPSQHDLKDLSSQELTKKISNISTKMSNDESQRLQDFNDMDIQDIDSIQQLQDLDIDLLQMKAQPRELRNILDEQYLGDKMLWNDVNIYDFH